MKINILILVVVIGVTFIGTFLLDRQKTGNNIHTAPNFAFQTINKVRGSLHDFQGKKILVHFWATWCAPCLIEFPKLAKLAQNHPEDLIILTISTDKQLSDIKRFLKKMKLAETENFLIIHDPYEKISKEVYKVKKFPESYFLNKDFHIQKRIIGGDEKWLSPQWDEMIRK